MYWLCSPPRKATLHPSARHAKANCRSSSMQVRPADSPRVLHSAQSANPLIDTAPEFVDELFRVIEYKSYLPGAPPPPEKRHEPTGENLYAGFPAFSAPSDTSASIISRKRSFNDRGHADGEYGMGEERAYKQPRRSLLDAAVSSPNGYPGQPHNNAGFPQLNYGMAQYDPNFPQAPPGPNDWRVQLPQGTGAYPQVSTHLSSHGSRRKRQRCRDFANKGYCARGNACQYDHGIEPIWVPPAGSNGPNEFEGE